MHELTFDIQNIKQMFDLRPFMGRVLTAPRPSTPAQPEIPESLSKAPTPQIKKAQTDIIEQMRRRQGRAASRSTTVGLLDEVNVRRPVLSDILA